MADLSIDLNPASSTYGDLLLINGDAVLTSDIDSRGSHPVLQHILQRLREFQGEWYLNTADGVPYYQEVLIKGATIRSIGTIFRTAILNTPGVLQLSKLSVVLNAALRNLSLEFTASTTAGAINYKGTLEYSPGGFQT